MINPHVVSLELSKKLKKLGFDKPSTFAYLKPEAPTEEIVTIFGKTDGFEVVINDTFPESWENYPAYMATELLEWLPSEINLDSNYNSCKCFYLTMIKREDKYRVVYENSNYPHYWFHSEEDNNLPNALAKMLIFLIENYSVKVDKT